MLSLGTQPDKVLPKQVPDLPPIIVGLDVSNRRHGSYLPLTPATTLAHRASACEYVREHPRKSESARDRDRGCFVDRTVSFQRSIRFVWR